MDSNFNHLIANDCYTEYDYAEIYHGNEMWAQINQEQSTLHIKIYKRANEESWKFHFNEALNAVKEAKDHLLGIGMEVEAQTPLFADLTEDPLNIDTSSWMLKSYPLNKKAAFNYLSAHLKEKDNLSEAIKKNVDFNKGHFFAILPERVNDSKVYLFNESILPPPEGSQFDNQNFAIIYNSWFDWIRAPTQRLLRKWMIQRGESFICRDTLNKPSTLNMEPDQPLSVFWNEQSYHRVNPKEHEWRLLRAAFDFAETSFYFLGVMFKEQEGLFKGDRIQDGAFERIAKNASLVLIGAYNGDGYIFWQKDPFDLHSIGIPVANHKEL